MNEMEQIDDADPVDPTTMQHSPGPWKLYNEPGDVLSISDALGNSIMGDAQYYPWAPIDEADWQLIAAAPDLLASLREALEYFDTTEDVGFSHEALIRARAAVARAVGKNS